MPSGQDTAPLRHLDGRATQTKKPPVGWLFCCAVVRRRRRECGGAKEDRTPDLVIANDALSQLSYGPGVLQHGLGTAMRSSVAPCTPGCQGPALHLPTCVTQLNTASRSAQPSPCSRSEGFRPKARQGSAVGGSTPLNLRKLTPYLNECPAL